MLFLSLACLENLVKVGCFDWAKWSDACQVKKWGVCWDEWAYGWIYALSQAVEGFSVNKNLLKVFLDAVEETWSVVKEIDRETNGWIDLEMKKNHIWRFSFRGLWIESPVICVALIYNDENKERNHFI